MNIEFFKNRPSKLQPKILENFNTKILKTYLPKVLKMFQKADFFFEKSKKN